MYRHIEVLLNYSNFKYNQNGLKKIYILFINFYQIRYATQTKEHIRVDLYGSYLKNNTKQKKSITASLNELNKRRLSYSNFQKSPILHPATQTFQFPYLTLKGLKQRPKRIDLIQICKTCTPNLPVYLHVFNTIFNYRLNNIVNIHLYFEEPSRKYFFIIVKL